MKFHKHKPAPSQQPAVNLAKLHPRRLQQHPEEHPPWHPAVLMRVETAALTAPHCSTCASTRHVPEHPAVNRPYCDQHLNRTAPQNRTKCVPRSSKVAILQNKLPFPAIAPAHQSRKIAPATSQAPQTAPQTLPPNSSASKLHKQHLRRQPNRPLPPSRQSRKNAPAPSPSNSTCASNPNCVLPSTLPSILQITLLPFLMHPLDDASG